MFRFFFLVSDILIQKFAHKYLFNNIILKKINYAEIFFQANINAELYHIKILEFYVVKLNEFIKLNRGQLHIRLMSHSNFQKIYWMMS